MTLTSSAAALARSRWFGPETPIIIAYTLFANVTPFLAAPLLGIMWLALAAPCELVFAALLCLPRSRSRPVGTGILIALLACAGAYSMMLLFTFVSDRL